MKGTEPLKKSKKKQYENAVLLSDESAHPGPDFVERYVMDRTREDTAILDAWKFRFYAASGKKHNSNRYIQS